MSPANKRVTVYLKPEYHRALRIKAAETEYSVSDLVNLAVKQALLEDAVDLEAFDKRAREPLLIFGSIFLANLELGYLTPPVGLNLLLASYRFNEPMPRVYRDVRIFLGLGLAVVLLIT